MTTLRFMLDFDGCFAGSVKISEDKKQFCLQGSMIEHMIAQVKRLNPNHIEIASYSNRQDFYVESTNSLGHGTISSFQAFEALIYTLKKEFPGKQVYLDKYLLLDSHTNSPTGNSWDTIMKHIYIAQSPLSAETLNAVSDLTRKSGLVSAIELLDKKRKTFPLSGGEAEKLRFPFNQIVCADKLKLLMFYIQAHRACSFNEQVHAIVYEDTELNLEAIYLFTRQYPDLFPRDFTLEMYAYNMPLSEEEKITYDQDKGKENKYVSYLAGIENNGEPEPYPYTSPESEANKKCAYSKNYAMPACFMNAYQEPFPDNFTVRTLRGTGKINKQWFDFYRQFQQQLVQQFGVDGVTSGVWEANMPGLPKPRDTTGRIIHALHPQWFAPEMFFSKKRDDGFVLDSYYQLGKGYLCGGSLWFYLSQYQFI